MKNIVIFKILLKSVLIGLTQYPSITGLKLWTCNVTIYDHKLNIGESKFLIGLMGSSFFLGWVISCIFLPRLADIYGRKWFVFITQCVMASIFICFIFVKDVYSNIGLFILLGTCNVGRSMVAFILMMELTPQK
jgi:MFS family permease